MFNDPDIGRSYHPQCDYWLLFAVTGSSLRINANSIISEDRMEQHALTRPLRDWLVCPCCGQYMLTVEIAIATPPLVVELSGCANCGITANEFTSPEAARRSRLYCDHGRGP
jgi:hypothetical protein